MKVSMQTKKQDSRNYYEVLEVPVNATQQEVLEGYNRLKNAYSGDGLALYSLLSKEECSEVLNLVEEAYSILSEPSKRREYDDVRGLLPQNTRTSSSPREAQDLFAERPWPPQRPKESSHERDDFSILRKEAEVSRIAATNRFTLDYEKDPQMEQEIENTTVFTGGNPSKNKRI